MSTWKGGFDESGPSFILSWQPLAESILTEGHESILTEDHEGLRVHSRLATKSCFADTDSRILRFAFSKVLIITVHVFHALKYYLPSQFQRIRSRGCTTLLSSIMKCCTPMSCYQWHDMFLVLRATKNKKEQLLTSMSSGRWVTSCCVQSSKRRCSRVDEVEASTMCDASCSC